MITASISFVGNLIFLFLASGEEQSWNRDDDDVVDEQGKTNKNTGDNIQIDLPIYSYTYKT